MDSVSQTILSLIVVLIAAKTLGELAERVGQPAVLGELVAGIILGQSLLHFVHETPVLHMLAEIGVILLLFEIGLESDIEEFLRVGKSALAVAVVGVAGPFIVGYVIARLFGASDTVAIYIGATLTATSVGITARTLTDMGRLHTSEARIILGAAVIDDVLGLIILAVVVSLVSTGIVSVWQVVKTTMLAIVFLVGAIVLGIPIAPRVLRLVQRMRIRGVLTASAFVFCLFLAYVASKLGLATIVGAFAAGLVLARTEDLGHIQERMKPLADVFVPIFFVMLGVQVNLSVFNPIEPANRPFLVFTLLLIVVAMLMKVLSGAGVLEKGVNRLAVGVGMIPRGEVGLIFASIGLAHKVISSGQYSTIIAIVFTTTFLTPPILKFVFERRPTFPPKGEKTSPVVGNVSAKNG